MGHSTAAGYAELVDDGGLSLTTAMHIHLTSNHYPPVPTFMVPVAVAAVEAGQDEDWDRELELPVGCTEHKVVLSDENRDEHEGHETEACVQWRGREDGKVRAGDVIESFHLDTFL